MRTVLGMLAVVMLVACGELESDGAELGGEEAREARTLAEMPDLPETEELEPEPELEQPPLAAAPDAAALPAAADAGVQAPAPTPDAGAPLVEVKPAFYDGRPIRVLFDCLNTSKGPTTLRFTVTIHANGQGVAGYDTLDVYNETTKTKLRLGTGRMMGWPRWVGGTPDGYTFALLLDDADTDAIGDVSVTGAAMPTYSPAKALQVATYADQE